MNRRSPFTWTLLALLGLAAAGPAGAQEAKQLRIVKQPGLGYLSIIVMREMKLIEKRAPGVDVEWLQLTSGAVIRDAMVAGQIDIGSGGTGPFVQAIDKGLDWKTLGALNQMPLFLNCARADIKSLRDLKPTDRIAMPAIGSIQHVVLQMQAEKELGDPKKLNQQIVAMSHPDATAAILSKREITCHLSSPPFQYEQLRDSGIHKVFDSYQAVGGPHTFNLVWASEKWVKANPRLVQAFREALKEATEFINDKPAEAARLYATSEKAKSTPEELLAIMKQDGIRYTMTPSGLIKFASFMRKIGMIKSVPASWRDYAQEHLHGLPGS
ncbi:MAG TPA: ABC transporter substrate-binding protein [Methylomirabilota bacterium]|jgi:NitT/TauT family transport system substrate-binding protein|nr:ABC transporter substrate-binding protein [Methylomirabilota bacterium]